jgi:hypothetical protein
MAATHILESQGQALSASLKHKEAWQPLTRCRAKDMHCQVETQQGMAATHKLKSQGQVLLAGLKHGKAQRPLTS